MHWFIRIVCVQVWKLGWSPQPGGEYGTTLPEIPVDFLQEKDVFREFLYRINTLGTHTHSQKIGFPFVSFAYLIAIVYLLPMIN